MLGITRPQIAYRLKRYGGTEALTLRPSTFDDANRVRLMPAQLSTRLPPQVAAYLTGHHAHDAGHPGEGKGFPGLAAAPTPATMGFADLSSAPNTRHCRNLALDSRLCRHHPGRLSGSGRRSRASSSKAVSSNCRATRKTRRATLRREIPYRRYDGKRPARHRQGLGQGAGSG